MYKTTKKVVKMDNTECAGVVSLSDFAVIPEDDETGSYAEYLSWVAEGNTPEEWTTNEH